MPRLWLHHRGKGACSQPATVGYRYVQAVQESDGVSFYLVGGVTYMYDILYVAAEKGLYHRT